MRHQISDRPGHYYATINARAAQIYNHQEKQKFLKALYESFYRAYNPKAADHASAKKKQLYLRNNRLQDLPFDHIIPS